MQHEIKIEVLEKLKQIDLPKGWEVSKLTVEFKKRNLDVPIESQSIVFDNMNNVFYAQTARGFIYPDESKSIKECLSIMEQANKIIKDNATA